MYVTFYKRTRDKVEEIADNSLEAFLFGGAGIEFKENLYIPSEYKKITLNKPKEELKTLFEKNLNPAWLTLPPTPNYPVSQLKDHYQSFKIPKKSGGLRQIDAPDENLKLILGHWKTYFEDTLKILPHDAAHAYVRTRSTITMMKKHQINESKWFLKLDFHSFFPSHNLDYVMKTFENIYPLCFLLEDPVYKKDLRDGLEYAFLNGVLPQGTPLSPTLTNILMMGIDYDIQHLCWNEHSKMIYTRYADDIVISSPYKFEYKKLQEKIIKVIKIHKAPFTLSKEKTRFGSSAGRNWNMGLMLNKDNRLTIGHKQNQIFRAMLNNIMQDYKRNIFWSAEDRAELGGKIAYYKAVDPDYTNAVIQRYEKKFNVKLKDILNNVEKLTVELHQNDDLTTQFREFQDYAQQLFPQYFRTTTTAATTEFRRFGTVTGDGYVNRTNMGETPF